MQAMAVYADIREMKTALQNLPALTREDLLQMVKFATVRNHAPYQCSKGVREITFLEAFDLRPAEHRCEECGEGFDLKQVIRKSRAGTEGAPVSVNFQWRRQQKSNCDTCGKGTCKPSALSKTILAELASDHWMDFLDLLTMWSME